MTFYSIVFIAFGLAMDAFAVSVSNGVAVNNFRIHQKIKMSLWFGIFQSLMPLLGFFLGSAVVKYVAAFDHWIAFICLSLIGLNMIAEARKKEEENKQGVQLSTKMLLLQAIATSIDAFIIGITFSVLKIQIFTPVLIIGAVCFMLSLIGAFLGEKLGGIFKEKAEILGGVILIIIGLKTLIEHLFFL